MKRYNRQIIFYLGLLLVSAGFSLWASLPENETDLRQIKITEINPAEIVELQWQTSKLTTMAKRRTSDGKFWIVSGDDSFLANQRLEETLKTLNPFFARRLVSRVTSESQDELSKFGLNPPTATLTVVRRAKRGTTSTNETTNELKIIFGRNSFGTTDRYVLTPDGKNIVLVAGDTISGLDNPVARFFERTVFPAKLADSDTVEFLRGDQAKSFTKNNSAKDPDKFDPQLSDWFEKAERLRGIRYADEGLEARLVNTVPELAVKFKNKNNETEEIVIKTLAAEDKNGQATWWVISTQTKAHLEITSNRAEPLIKDAESLLLSTDQTR